MLVFSVFFAAAATAQEKLDVTIGYLEQVVPPPPVLSNLEPVPEDQGLAGVELGIKDNATTGKFLKHGYFLEKRVVEEGGDLAQAAKELVGLTPLIVVNAPRDDLLKLADAHAESGAIFINASAPDVDLRDAECRSNVFHTMPSRAMLSDALAQFAVRKKWTRWAMIEGRRDGDKALASAFEKSAAKFRLKLEARKSWNFETDMRRSAASEVPIFTQDLPDHDLLVVADEADDFARYIAYHTWLPRPIAGSEGVVPSTWSASVEQHGAAQLQSRFRKSAGRDMRPVDYAAWLAVRAIGEAVTRTKARDPRTLRDYMVSDKFELAAFKGRKATFRGWNGQMRQPIPLSHPRAVVALAPLEGFLHRRNELDTLGLDKPESACAAFGN